MSDIPIKEFVERILEEKDRAQEVRFEASQRALDLASQALTHRLESMNEFRRQIDSERALYIRRDQLAPIEERLKILEQQRAVLVAGLSALVVFMNVALRYWKP